MPSQKFRFFTALCVAAWGLCWAGPAAAQNVRIVHCSDVQCSPVLGAPPGQQAVELEARYPQHAGASLRVVLVSQRDKQAPLVELRSSVAADGRFSVSLPLRGLPEGLYDIGVLAPAAFLAAGQIQLLRGAARGPGPAGMD